MLLHAIRVSHQHIWWPWRSILPLPPSLEEASWEVWRHTKEVVLSTFWQLRIFLPGQATGQMLGLHASDYRYNMQQCQLYWLFIFIIQISITIVRYMHAYWCQYIFNIMKSTIYLNHNTNSVIMDIRCIFYLAHYHDQIIRHSLIFCDHSISGWDCVKYTYSCC